MVYLYSMYGMHAYRVTTSV